MTDRIHSIQVKFRVSEEEYDWLFANSPRMGSGMPNIAAGVREIIMTYRLSRQK